MELKDDQGVNFRLVGKSEMQNPAQFDGTFQFTVDDPSIVTLTDNGDGSGRVAATGALGTATVSVVATRNSDGKTFNGAEAFTVVAGDAEAIGFEFEEPTENTPDEAPTP